MFHPKKSQTKLHSKNQTWLCEYQNNTSNLHTNISFSFFGCRWLKNRSEKTEIARPKRGNDENGEKQGRGQAVAQENAALSRLVTNRKFTRHARARKFVAKFRRRMRKMSRKEGNTRAVNFGKCANIGKKCLRRSKSSERQLPSANGGFETCENLEKIVILFIE